MSASPITVALVGNPNTGKSTLFNALSGLRQHIGNYPGVTVEMKSGRYMHAGREYEVIDLPGTYSLAPRSLDEMVAVDLLLGRRTEHQPPDVVLSIVDASNLDRHLYLTTQLLELGRPVVLAVNMVDVAASQGLKLNLDTLAKETGLRVVAVQANRGVGLDQLREALHAAVGDPPPTSKPHLPEAVEQEVEALRSEVGGEFPTFLARRLLLDVGGYTEQWLVEKHGEALKNHLDAARRRLAESGNAIPAVEARTRYGWIRGITAKVVTKPTHRAITWTDRIDRVLTHRVWGTLFFLTMMFLVFQAIFVGASPFMEWIDQGVSSLAELVTNNLEPGPFRSLLADGVIGGVGSVVIFLPQILILFGFIAVLEDCGYMARAAFLMDRLMSRCGLNGKSFIPLLSSVACAIPGIMATRVIENRRDRLATILVAPLMSCSARLPVYALLIAAFLTDGFAWWVPGITLFGLYTLGFVLAPLVALVLKRTLLRGAPPLFVMELPAYRRPMLFAIIRRMVDAGWAFLRRAGTVIFFTMILVWALLYFPDRNENGRYEDQIEAMNEAEDADGANHLQGEWKRNSLLGRAGRAMEPVFEPLGWDWRIGMAALASFPAREVIVGTLVNIYDLGEEDDSEEGQSAMREAIHREWTSDPVRGKYSVAVALSVMVFFALCCQCASTLAVIRRETGSWAWPAFTFVYMTALAYLGALLTFQIGRLITDAML